MPYRAFNRNLTASFLAPFIITLSVLAAVVLWRFQYQASITSWVEHSDQVILRVKDIELELREMLSGLHEYLVQRVLDINDLKGTWTEAIDSLLSQKAGSQPIKQALAEAEARGRAVFNSLEDFIAAEEQLRVQRATRQRTEYYVVFVLIPALTAIVMIFLSYWGWRQIQLATARFHAALDTAERARDAAEKASAAAEKANRAKDNFVGMVSHELRTPLNSIMLWSAALLRNPALGERCAPRYDSHRTGGQSSSAID